MSWDFEPQKKRPAGSRRNPQVRNECRLLDSGRVVERNPSSTGLQAAPASGGTLTGFYFHDGEHALAGVLSDSGIVRASALRSCRFAVLLTIVEAAVMDGEGHTGKSLHCLLQGHPS